MTRNVVVTVNTQSDQVTTQFAFGGKVISLVSQTPGAPTIHPVTLPPNPAPGGVYTTTFTDVPADTYIATAMDIDSNGSPASAAVSSQPYAVVDVPTTQPYDITISIGLSAQ